MKIKLLSVALSSFILSQTAFANDANTSPSHDYIGLGYVDLSSDGLDASGYGFGGSKKLTDNIAITGSYLDGEVDGIPADISQLTLGVNFINSISDKTDVVLGANYVNAEASFLGYSEDISGTLATVGFQTRVSPSLELSGTIGYLYSSEEGVDDSTQVSVGLDYFITPAVSVGLEYANEDSADSILVGAKFHF